MGAQGSGLWKGGNSILQKRWQPFYGHVGSAPHLCSDANFHWPAGLWSPLQQANPLAPEHSCCLLWRVAGSWCLSSVTGFGDRLSFYGDGRRVQSHYAPHCICIPALLVQDQACEHCIGTLPSHTSDQAPHLAAKDLASLSLHPAQQTHNILLLFKFCHKLSKRALRVSVQELVTLFLWFLPKFHQWQALPGC